MSGVPCVAVYARVRQDGRGLPASRTCGGFVADGCEVARAYGCRPVVFTDSLVEGFFTGPAYGGLASAGRFALLPCDWPSEVVVAGVASGGMREAVGVLDALGIGAVSAVEPVEPVALKAEFLDVVAGYMDRLGKPDGEPCYLFDRMPVRVGRAAADIVDYVRGLLRANPDMQVRLVCDALTAQGFKPFRGGPWAASSALDIMRKARRLGEGDLQQRLPDDSQKSLPDVTADLQRRLPDVMPKVLDFVAERNVGGVLDNWLVAPLALVAACVQVLALSEKWRDAGAPGIERLVKTWFADNVWCASASGCWQVVPHWCLVAQHFVPVLVGFGKDARGLRAQGEGFVDA